MRNILALFGLLVIGFLGVGWYMGWYKLSFSRTSDGNLEIKTNVDTKKVGDDSSGFFKNAATAITNQAEKAAQDAKASTPAGAPGSTPGPVTPPAGAPTTPAPEVLPSIPVLPAPAAPGAQSPPRNPIQLIPPK